MKTFECSSVFERRIVGKPTVGLLRSLHPFRLIAFFLLTSASLPAAVKVYITGDATLAGTASCEITLSDDGATMDSAGNIDGSALLLPGKTYQLMINASDIANATINLRPTGNYEVVINGSSRRQIQVVNPATNRTLTEVFDVEIRTTTGGTQPGSDTGVAIGNEIAWGIGLGRLYNGAPAGNLVIRSTALDDSVFDRRLLSYSGINQQVSVIVDTGGKITQILAPETFVTVTDNDETGGFDIAFYPISAAGTRHPSGMYDLNAGATPYVIYYITPSLDTTNDFGFAVTKQAGSHVLATTAAYGAGTWMKDMGDQLSIEQRIPDDTFSVPDQRAEMMIIKNGNGTVAKKTKRIYQTFPWNKPDTQPEELIQEIQDPDGKAWITTYEYYASGPDKGSRGRVKSVTYPDGNWVKYDYYTDLVFAGRSSRTGMVSREYHPWLNAPSSPADAAPSLGRVTDYDYTTDWDGQKTIVSSRIETINGVTVGKMIATVAINQTFNNLKAWTYTQTFYTSATASLTTITKAYQPNQTDSNALFNGLLIFVENSDGAKISYAHQCGTYANGVFTVSDSGSVMREIEVNGVRDPAGLASIHGAPLDPVGVVANRSTAVTRIREKGRLMEESTAIYNGVNFEEVSWTAYTYDDAGRLISRVNSNDTAYSATYDGDFKTSETTETGIHQTYLPDALLRVASITKTGVASHADGHAAQPALHTELTYDATGRITTQQRHDGIERTTRGSNGRPEGEYCCFLGGAEKRGTESVKHIENP